MGGPSELAKFHAGGVQTPLRFDPYEQREYRAGESGLALVDGKQLENERRVDAPRPKRHQKLRRRRHQAEAGERRPKQVVGYGLWRRKVAGLAKRP